MSTTDKTTNPDDSATPLVSVIVRSIGRETLQQALDSIAAQTYPNIEVVLVNAKGPGHPELGEWCGSFSMRICSDGKPLSRSRAANFGLDNARGDFLIFLDDDDWFMPDHLAGLIQEIISHDGLHVAYSGIRCMRLAEHGSWEEVRTFNYKYDRIRIWCENYIPIHAVLFSRGLLNDGCRFDENLDVYEDWDFWIQASLRSSFAHVDRISAVYRITAETGHGIHGEIDMEQHASALLYCKWRLIWSDQQFLEIMKYAKTRWYLDEDRSALLGEHIRFKKTLFQHEILKRRQAILYGELYSLESELSRMRTLTRAYIKQPIGYFRSVAKIVTAGRNIIPNIRHILRDAVASPRRAITKFNRMIMGSALKETFLAMLSSRLLKIKRPPAGLPVYGEPTQLYTLYRRPVHFIQFEDVTLSIVVTVTQGNRNTVLQCLEAVRDHINPDITYEVVVSGILDDDFKSSVSSIPGITIVSPLGNCNLVDYWEAGIDAARGELLVVLPDYFFAQQAWSDALIDAFNKDPNLGLIAPKIVSDQGMLCSAGGVILNDGTISVRGYGENPNLLNYCHSQEIDCPTEPCFALRRELLGIVGGFDHNYTGWPSQLADFSLKVEAFGQKNMYHPFVRFVGADAHLPREFHVKGEFGGGEAGNDRRLLSRRFQGYLRYLQRQRPIAELRRKGHERILVIDVIVPTPDKDAGSMRIFRILEIFKSLSYDVTFLPANLEYKQGYVESLQSRGIRVLYSPYVESIDQYLNEEGQNFDIIMVSRVEIAHKLIDPIKCHAPRAFVIFDTVDLHFLREERRAILTGDQELMARAIE